MVRNIPYFVKPASDARCQSTKRADLGHFLHASRAIARQPLADPDDGSNLRG